MSSSKKDTFYFSHDYNVRNDDKIKALIRKHGMTGYGIFWVIVEDLYNNANALRLDYKGIAYDLRTKSEIIESIINDFDLFVINDNSFSSNSVSRRLEDRNYKSINARKSALARWEKKEENANALQTVSESNAIKENKVKENKVKENKDSKEPLEIRKANFKTQVLIFQKDYSVELLKSFFEYWTETTPGGSKMKFELQRTWETGKRLITWKKNEANFKGSKEATVVKLPTFDPNDIPEERINNN